MSSGIASSFETGRENVTAWSGPRTRTKTEARRSRPARNCFGRPYY